MKKTDQRVYEAWVMKVWDKYREKLHLQRHTNVKLQYNPDINCMECSFRYPYLDNEIRYNDNAVRMWKEDKANALRAVVHEFCHILTDPFYGKAVSRYVGKDEMEDEREMLTDNLAGIFIELIEK